MSGDLARRGAAQLARDIAARRIGASEAVLACLARIEALNPSLNAICTLTAESALAEARECDRRLAAGAPPRALEGIPFVAKDNLPSKGVRTTYGALPFAEHVPQEDAICIERLKAAGAILLGKTNTPEFASDVITTNRLFGATRNPWAPARTAGGSSGGTGAAVAAGMAPLGLGTDLGGSIRVPASFNGLVGLRTVPGRVPVYPADFAWDTLVEHVHGPLTRTVEDCGLMMSVLAGPDERAPNSLPGPAPDYVRAASGATPIEGRRIAYSFDLNGLAPVDPEVAALTRAAALEFQALGCRVDEACPDLGDLRAIIAGTRAFGMVGRYADYLDAYRPLMSAQLARQVADALAVDVRTITAAERMRSAYYQRVRAFLTRYDYLLCPTTGVPAFRLDRPLPDEIGGKRVARFYDAFLFTYAFSVTGLPAISVPCGFTRDCLPVGLQIVSRRLREDLVLEAAAAYLKACPQQLREAPAVAVSPQELAPPHPSLDSSSDWMRGSGAGTKES